MQYADDVAVVSKPEPEKAGNRLEDTNLGDMEHVSMAIATQKVVMDAKDGRNSKCIQQLK